MAPISSPLPRQSKSRGEIEVLAGARQKDMDGATATARCACRAAAGRLGAMGDRVTDTGKSSTPLP